MIGVILDIIIVAIIAVSAFIGYRKGLMLTLFSLCSIIVSIILSSILQPLVTNIVVKTGIKEVKILVFVIVAILVFIALQVISFALKIFSKLPIIHSFDKLGGLIIGLIIGFFICIALLALIHVISGLVDMELLTKAIKDSFIGDFFHKNNLFLLLAING